MARSYLLKGCDKFRKNKNIFFYWAYIKYLR